MPISKKHGLPKKEDRKPSANRVKLPGGRYRATHITKFYQVDEVVDHVYCDIANGVSKSDILQKLTNGLYEPQDKPLGQASADDYYNAAVERFRLDKSPDEEQMRAIFYGRYEALLEEAVKKGDIYNARAVLDSMSKIFGIERKTPDTAIQVNTNNDSVQINFGFDNDKN